MIGWLVGWLFGMLELVRVVKSYEGESCFITVEENGL